MDVFYVTDDLRELPLGYIFHHFYNKGSKPIKTPAYPFGYAYVSYISSGIETDIKLPKSEQWIVHSIRNKPYTLFMNPQSFFCGLGLQPYGLYALCKTSPTKIGDSLLPIEAVLPKSLCEKFYATPIQKENYKLALDHLSNILLNEEKIYFGPYDLVIKIVERVKAVKGCITCAQIANENTCSRRYLDKWFRHITGISLLQYIRLLRFQYFMSEIVSKDRCINDIVMQYNFYDYSHFYKDFKRFTGIVFSEYEKNNNFMINKSFSLSLL